MTQHLIDTDIKIATCPRCDGYVFKAQCGGSLIAAESLPLGGLDAVRDALMAGKLVHQVVYRQGRPWRLKTLTACDNLGALDKVIVADHQCTRSMNASNVQEVPQDPLQAPVTPGEHWDGRHHPDAYATGSQGLSAAQLASRHRSEQQYYRKMITCDRCKKRIIPGQTYFGIEIPGQASWYVHDHDCHHTAEDQLIADRDFNAIRHLVRNGDCTRPMETIELPAQEE